MSISSGIDETFIASGQLPSNDSVSMPEHPGRSSAHLRIVLDLGSVDSAAIARHVLLSYTEGYAIQYFQRNLHPIGNDRQTLAAHELVADLNGQPMLFAKEKARAAFAIRRKYSE